MSLTSLLVSLFEAAAAGAGGPRRDLIAPGNDLVDLDGSVSPVKFVIIGGNLKSSIVRK